MKFSIRQMQAFDAVAQTGSVSKAGVQLGVSQPAVSRLLADFSKTVAFELFTRQKGNLVPTNEAKYILYEVRRVFDGLEHLQELGRDLTERTAGHLRIACLPGFASNHLPEVLARFLSERPGVTVSIEPDRPERILEWIIDQKYDFGITDGFSGHPFTQSEEIPIRSVCILPKNHKLSSNKTILPIDLIDEKIIHTRSDSPFHRSLLKAFSEAGVPINSWIEVRQFSTACEIITQGYGASIVSALDAEQFRTKEITIKPFRPKITHELSMIRSTHVRQSLLALDFWDTFSKSLEPYKQI